MKKWGLAGDISTLWRVQIPPPAPKKWNIDVYVNLTPALTDLEKGEKRAFSAYVSDINKMRGVRALNPRVIKSPRNDDL